VMMRATLVETQAAISRATSVIRSPRVRAALVGIPPLWST
jgi:hypothetical protein